LVWGTSEIGPATTALHQAGVPSALGHPIPRLQDATFGSATMGWLDLVAPALLGVVAGAKRLRAAVVTGLAAGAWGLLLLVTSTVLADESQRFLDGLQPQGKASGVALYHGSARDPVWEYVLSDEAAAATFALTEEQLVLVGHSHAALQVSFRDSLLEGGLAPRGTEVELGGARRLLNPGSVGQPRDGDPRAAYLLLDVDRERASFRRVEYDIERTQTEIRDAGLPQLL